jgi:molecular chaperone DnaK (HSP70)
MREMCNKIKLDLSQNEKTTFKINEIISNSELVFEINRKEYEKFFYDFIFDLKQLIKKLFEQKKMNNCAINQILYIGDIFNDEKIKLDIEQLLREKNLLSEEILNNENKDLDKEFYNVGGSAYYAMSINNNHENNINDFQDLSSFNIGIKIYNDTLFYFIKKGDIIPMKKSALIKLNKNSNIEIYEEDSKTKNKKLIWKFDINNEFIMNNNLNEKKSKYFEIIIEYQINEELNLILRISNGKNFSKELFFNILNHLS